MRSAAPKVRSPSTPKAAGLVTPGRSPRRNEMTVCATVAATVTPRRPDGSNQTRRPGGQLQQDGGLLEITPRSRGTVSRQLRFEARAHQAQGLPIDVELPSRPT